MSHYTYLLILAFTLSYPLYKSFEDKVQYYKKWKALLPALLITAVIFISWDILFTDAGVWSFNPDFILGYYLVNLPIEEWCFFVIVPFSCVFIYEVLNYFVRKDLFGAAAKYITIVLSAFLLIIAALHTDRLHTFITCGLLALVLLKEQFVAKSPWMGRYYLTWTVCTIPFLIVNGILTAAPVVIYNDLHITNFRIYTIPVEDLFYGMLNILLVISFYENFKKRKT